MLDSIPRDRQITDGMCEQPLSTLTISLLKLPVISMEIFAVLHVTEHTDMFDGLNVEGIERQAETTLLEVHFKLRAFNSRTFQALCSLL